MKKLIKNTLLRLFKDTRFEPVVLSMRDALLPKSELIARKDNRNMSQIIRYILKENSNCIDVGAHDGDVLAEILRASPLGNHYAFEPLPYKACGLRKLFPQVNIYEVALGEKEEEANFFYNVSDPGYSGLKQRRYDRPPTGIQNINCTSLSTG